MIPFSVIIPNYNHGAFLKQRMESILSQRYTCFELIILDDASTDNSREIIETYRHHPSVSSIIFNDTNSGSPFRQWKKGIEAAKYEWVWIAESDDFAEPDFLEKIALRLQAQTEAGLLYTDSFILDETGGGKPEKFSSRKNTIFHSSKWAYAYENNGLEEVNECLKYDCTVNNASAMVFKKSLCLGWIHELEDFRYYGDWYFILRLCMKTNISYLPEPLNHYRKHASSHLHSNTLLIISRYEYFRIFKLLYHHPSVKDKGILLQHFVLQHLSFGLIEDGLMTGFRIFSSYFKEDQVLALKTALSMVWIKLRRKKWKQASNGKFLHEDLLQSP